MELVYKNEKPLFVGMLTVSVLAWMAILIGSKGVALFYAPVLFLFYCFAQSALISYLKGTAVHVTGQQFPDLKARIDACSARLGVEPVPHAYLLQQGGGPNAFTTRFLGRHFIVLQADVVDALEERPDAINFYIGHQIGQIARQYLRWAPLLIPASVLPLLGAAYARARAYTCDRHGFHACDNLDSAQIGLAALAAGGKRWRRLNVDSYVGQSRHSVGFWMSFHELVADHPWLVKRMGAMRALAQGEEVQQPERNGLAYLLALCVPRLGVGGGAGSVLALLAMLGALAALGVVAYQDFNARARMNQAVNVGHEATAAVERYFYANGKGPVSLEQAGFALADPSHAVQDIRVDAENGVVRVFPSDLAYRGKSIAFTPNLDENKKVAWRCGSEEIPAHLLPPACRVDGGGGL
ncbi:pilin [Oxalobacteraceae bacterium]|nr:pilin [Oxalobacteraceae bacterium]